MIPLINSYFSGCGIMELGFYAQGLPIQQSFEIDADCCRVHRDNFEHPVSEVDITQKLVLEDHHCDAMIGTFPCTKYSKVADIHGTRTGDALFLHFMRHVAIAQPEVFVIENVPGMLAFPVVMEAFEKLPGYKTKLFHRVEAHYWLPQRRRRVMLFGSKKRFTWIEPKQEDRIQLADIVEEEPQVSIPKAVATRMNGGYRDLPIISDPAKNDLAPTCVAHYAKDKSTRLLKDHRYPLGVRPYSVREFARLQGVADGFSFNCSPTSAYKMIGNGVPKQMGEWVAKNIKKYFN